MRPDAHLIASLCALALILSAGCTEHTIYGQTDERPIAIAAIETPVDWLLEAGEHPNVRDQMQVQFDLLRRWDTRITYGQTHRCLVLHGARAALYEARHGALPASLAEIEAALGNDDPSCDLDPFTLEDWVLQRGAGEWRLTSPAADRAEELGLWADAPGRLTIHVVSRAAGIR